MKEICHQIILSFPDASIHKDDNGEVFITSNSEL